MDIRMGTKKEDDAVKHRRHQISYLINFTLIIAYIIWRLYREHTLRIMLYTIFIVQKFEERSFQLWNSKMDRNLIKAQKIG